MPADGRHRVFLPMDDTLVKAVKKGSPPNWRWNKANVQSVGGGFAIHSDASATGASNNSAMDSVMRFYVGARSGYDQIGGNASAGFAELRRDVRDR